MSEEMEWQPVRIAPVERWCDVLRMRASELYKEQAARMELVFARPTLRKATSSVCGCRFYEVDAQSTERYWKEQDHAHLLKKRKHALIQECQILAD